MPRRELVLPLVRRAAERRLTTLPWLESWHSFAFGWYDRRPDWRSFRCLRALNEDHVAPGAGFGEHPHQDMEILTWVLAGEVEHRDSRGGEGRVRAGELQRMTAGTGIDHSERNPSPRDPLHLLQIWIEPATRGLPPGYEQRAVPAAAAPGAVLLASPDGREGSVTVHQDARLFSVRVGPDRGLSLELAPGRHAFVQVTEGSLAVGDALLEAGDGLGLRVAAPLALAGAGTSAAALVFDLP